tara:strand:- start:830 stop:2212 length:1383 start_codon:yes stop_codon:yes gene_type:complete
MTQEVFPDIDPNVTSGTELAILLNEFKASLLTQHSGVLAPTYAEIGTPWFDTAVATKMTFKLYDGSQWVTQFVLDTTAHTISYGGNNPTASFTVNRTDTSADMLEMFRDTSVQTNGGLIFSQKNDGATKKTMAKLKFVSENVVSGAEEASVLFECMVAGVLISIFEITKDSMFVEAFKGSGDRVLGVDPDGNVAPVQIQTASNIFPSGSAASADILNYTANAPLTLVTSSVSTELIDSTKVFKAVSTAISETFETEDVPVPNGFIDSPMIVSMKLKSAANWTVELRDADTESILATSTIEAYNQTLNESKLHKFFGVIPSTTANIKLVFTSTAGDTLLFDTVEMYSWMAKDEPLYFSVDLLNNQTNTDLFLITNRKNEMLKIEGQVLRETDTELADGIYESFITNNGTVWRVGKESEFDHEDDLIETSLNMNANTLRYSTGNLVGANYTGKFVGRITRAL